MVADCNGTPESCVNKEKSIGSKLESRKTFECLVKKGNFWNLQGNGEFDIALYLSKSLARFADDSSVVAAG